MPYSVKVLGRDDSVVVLDVTPEQPDAEPFPLDAGFAVGLLLGAAHELKWDDQRNANIEVPTGALGRALRSDSFELLAAGGGDPGRFVRSASVTNVTSWPWQYGKPA